MTSRFGNGTVGAFSDAAFALAIQPDGRILVAGRAQPGYAAPFFGLIRYEADGSLDRTFAPCAVVMTPFPPVGSIGSHATALLVQPDGKLVAVGDALDDFALTRYVGTGGASACEPAAVGKATLRLRSDVNTRHPHLAWRWIGASAVVRSDFGDPTDATDLTLCVLDGSGALKLAATTPANPCAPNELCWHATSDAYAYSGVGHVSGCLDGLTRIGLRPGAAGKARIRTQGGVCGLGVPSPPLTSPVVVRLQRGDGPNCWEATFSNPSVNDEKRFTARSD